MTLVPPTLLREIAGSYQDAAARLERLEMLLDGMAAWKPLARDPAGESDEELDDEYAPLPNYWHARKDHDWLAELGRFNDLADEFRAAFNATDDPKAWPYPSRDGEPSFDARRYAGCTGAPTRT